jgi:hypothetical protein
VVKRELKTGTLAAYERLLDAVLVEPPQRA